MVIVGLPCRRRTPHRRPRRLRRPRRDRQACRKATISSPLDADQGSGRSALDARRSARRCREARRGAVLYRDFITVGVLLRSPGGALAGDEGQLDLRAGARRQGRAAADHSTTGAPTWLRTPRPSGWGWSTSRTRATSCWSKPSEEFAQSRDSTSSSSLLPWSIRNDVLDHTVIHVPKAYPGLLRDLRSFCGAAGVPSTASRTCFLVWAQRDAPVLNKQIRIHSMPSTPRWSRSRTSPPM